MQPPSSDADADSAPSARQPSGKTGNGKTYSFLPASWHRKAVLKWLRRTHAWLGLWGAVLGLLFSFTGILLNHRDLLKIDLPRADLESTRIELPAPPPADPQAMAAWLQDELAIEQPLRRINVTPPKQMEWGDETVWQPAQWRISFSVPHHSITAIYWEGNSFVRVEDFKPNIFMTLDRLHRADSINIAWILVTDSMAASIIVLAMTGLLLWTKLHGTRLAAVGLSLGAAIIAGASYLALM
jgi:hypothetical protein